MKTLIIVPVAMILIMTLAVELFSIAESVSVKTANFALDMENAIDCATRGIDIYECSPNLASYDFQPDLNRTIELNYDFLDEIQEMNPENYTIVINDENQTLIIFI